MIIVIILFAKTSLLKLDPFDYDGFTVFAQGDCSWEDFLWNGGMSTLFRTIQNRINH